VGEVRAFLHKQGYEITKEHMLKEDGKFYVMMRAVKSDIPQSYETECDYVYGKLLLEEKNPVLLEYLDREHLLRADVLTALAGQNTENARARKESLAEEFSLIEEARVRMNAEK